MLQHTSSEVTVRNQSFFRHALSCHVCFRSFFICTWSTESQTHNWKEKGVNLSINRLERRESFCHPWTPCDHVEQPNYQWPANHHFSTGNQLRISMRSPLSAVPLPVQFHFRRHRKCGQDIYHPGLQHPLMALAKTCSKKHDAHLLGWTRFFLRSEDASKMRVWFAM